MQTQEIREKFSQYFQALGHQRVPSSSLVPFNDTTLLFTNSGMVQFKETFLGVEPRSYRRAVSVQRCVRAGGKHNDLENVGYTARHHTFFEMLGNFSFGDYFKREAIRFAWDFLTKVLGIPQDKLWISVYKDDHEAEQIWIQEIGVDPQRISHCGESSNFWSMGDTGPCGPCTEIFYDHGAHIAGGPPGSPDEDGDRYVEIWNLVFMQFNRHQDGRLEALPKPSVDTGMGLERVAAVMQGVHNNYDIDLFQNLISAIIALGVDAPRDHPSLKVVADHIRSCAFLMMDGVLPSNEGRGYVLRRILRRAARHGHKLGLKQAFLYRLMPALVKEMGQAYPDLLKQQAMIEQALLKEETQFAETLDQGLKVFQQALKAVKGSSFSGEAAFKLYDTYGFPLDLTSDLAREHDLVVDQVGFDREMAAQRARSQAAQSFNVDYNQLPNLSFTSAFLGYDQLQASAKVLALVKEGGVVERLFPAERGLVVLDQTPFYAESGGQIGDRGWLLGEGLEFVVEDTQKQGGSILHLGYLKQGQLQQGQTILAEVDAALRQATALNHSATHLLHAALRQVLGVHVQQKGSLVSEDKLRFDFTHPQPLTQVELDRVESLVNTEIREDHLIHTELMAFAEAKDSGAMALFGEKYEDQVRVLSMGEFSKELCGGTHAERSGQIGCLRVTSETGVAAGIRRIEAVTGKIAFDWTQAREGILREASKKLQIQSEMLPEKLNVLLEEQKRLLKLLEEMKLKQVLASLQAAKSQMTVKSGVHILVLPLEAVEAKTLREAAEALRSQFESAVIVLASVLEGRTNFVAAVSKSCSLKLSAANLVQSLATQLGGKGGGRPELASGSAEGNTGLPEALREVETLIKNTF